MAADEADAPSSSPLFPTVTSEAVTEGLAGAVAWPVERLYELAEENRLAVRQLIRNLHRLEQRVAELAAAQETDTERVQELETELEAERERVAALEDRVEALEHQSDAVADMFSSKFLKRQRAHVDAQQRETGDVVARGEVRELVVEETLYDEVPPAVLGRIEGLVVFVKIAGRSIGIEAGDLIEVQITDLQATCAHARLTTEGER